MIVGAWLLPCGTAWLRSGVRAHRAALLQLRQAALRRASEGRGAAGPAAGPELPAAFLHPCSLSPLNAGKVPPAPEPGRDAGTAKGPDSRPLMQQTLLWGEQWWPASAKLLAFWVFGSCAGGRDRRECSDCPRGRACLKWEHGHCGHHWELHC